MPADGIARPYQSLRWATVAGKTLKNYKLIARHLCDRWQASQAQEGSTGQALAAGASCCSIISQAKQGLLSEGSTWTFSLPMTAFF